jgi:hypothetical protein
MNGGGNRLWGAVRTDAEARLGLAAKWEAAQQAGPGAEAAFGLTSA